MENNPLEARKRIVKEIVASESIYCQNLTSIISVCLFQFFLTYSHNKSVTCQK